MSQHDFIIANQTASSARTDINNALQSLASNNSGASAPSTTYANMWWYDTGDNILKQRNEADTAWINVAYVNQTTDKFEILDDTKVVTTSGTQVGILGDQATLVWETGTGTTESLVSPAKVRASAYPSESLSGTGHLVLGNVKQQWGRVLVTGQENVLFSITFDTTYSSTPWVITTTIEYLGSVAPQSFELNEAVIRSKSTSGFTGGFAAASGNTYSPVYVNYLAIGPA